MGSHRWPEWMKPGVRVVRGPDWSGPTLNPKEAELGTLTYVPSKVGDNKVNVVWDSARERMYSSGANGTYQLRAYDIQQVGVVHEGKQCSQCRAQPIRGIRYHCPNPDLNLCTRCYMEDRKSIDTAFVRYDTPSSKGVRLPKRSLSKNWKTKIKGVLENAQVVIGPHWNYYEKSAIKPGSTDTGTVLSVLPLKDGVAAGWVQVRWDIGGQIGEYRLGAGGFVEVSASQMAVGGQVYLEHLPVVGIIGLKASDKVCVNFTLEEFKQHQKKALANVGWIDAMAQCLQETGTVVEISESCDLARVQYTDGAMYDITKEVLYRKSGFSSGCAVTIINDKAALQNLQQGHGEYCPEICGKVGRVLTVMEDGDLRVLVDRSQHTVSPVCCEPVDNPDVAKTAPKMPDSFTEAINSRNTFGEKMNRTFSNLMRPEQSLESAAKQMYDAFMANDAKSLKALLEKHKQLVRYKMDAKTIVHLVCHSGKEDLLKLIIKTGGDIQEKDDEGDTPLHYAAHGGNVGCCKVLLKEKVDPNTQNNNGDTALMIAVNEGCLEMVKALLQYNAKVDIMDNDGSTVMHDVVAETDQPDLTEAILNSARADFTVNNKKQINVFIWAVLKNNLKAVQIILRQQPNVVKNSVFDGFTALHIAAANDFIEIVSVLLEKGKVDVNPRDSNQMTPLHLAAVQGHKRTAELLIAKKAQVDAKDKDGNTPLHLAQLPKIKTDLLMSVSNVSVMGEANIKITYALLEKGADMQVKNNKGETPMDLIQDKQTKDKLVRMALQFIKDPVQSKKGVTLPMHWGATSLLEIRRIPLTMDADVMEYDDVAVKFLETLDYCKIDCIERVQNPLLWEHYKLKKLEMEGRLGEGQANEIHLFHGTKPDLVDIIAMQNFDFRIAGTNVGARFGVGAYFAAKSKYSDGFATRDSLGFKYMFVVKVLAGKLCPGHPGLKRPQQGYDCSVDNVNAPAIYCVFDTNQYYPEYIVKYKPN